MPRRSRSLSFSKDSFHGLVGLVGKDPDTTRGLLIDTGAAINVHSRNWFKSFRDTCLKPLKLWGAEFQNNANITGVEGRSMGTDLGHRVPGGM